MGETSVSITRSCPDCGGDAVWHGVVAAVGGGTTYTRCVCPSCGVWPLVDLRKTATPRPVTFEPRYPPAIAAYHASLGRQTA